MALSKTISITGAATVSNGVISLPIGTKEASFDAYIKVESLRADKNIIDVTVTFSSDSCNFRKTYQFAPSMDGPNFIKQAYLHLKTLPEFAYAVDC